MRICLAKSSPLTNKVLTMDDKLIDNKIENLCQKVEVGFKGIHDRQDKTNGRIGKSEDRIRTMEKWMYTLIGGGVVLGFIPAISDILIKLSK